MFAIFTQTAFWKPTTYPEYACFIQIRVQWQQRALFLSSNSFFNIKEISLEKTSNCDFRTWRIQAASCSFVAKKESFYSFPSFFSLQFSWNLYKNAVTRRFFKYVSLCNSNSRVNSSVLHFYHIFFLWQFDYMFIELSQPAWSVCSRKISFPSTLQQ